MTTNSSDICLHDLFTPQAAKTPEATAPDSAHRPGALSPADGRVLDISVYNEVLPVSVGEACVFTRRLARNQHIIADVSSGAALWAASKIAQRPDWASRLVVVVLADTGERYLSTPLFQDPEAG